MRRAELQRLREMEVQQKNVLQVRLANSVFAQKLCEIPMFKSAVGTCGDVYSKVKGSNQFVGKSIELAVNISSAVVDKLAPIAEKGINVASPITSKVDEIAAASLDGLIARVPGINNEPKEVNLAIVQNTRCAIEKRLTVIHGVSEACMKTRPAQMAMDLYESILSTACTTLDNVLPPTTEEKADQNGLATKEAFGEDEKHKRGYILAQRTYNACCTYMRRMFGVYQTQVDNVDKVYNQVKSAVTDTSSAPQNSDQNNVNNGDANKNQNKKGKNKQKNNQE